MTVQKTTKFQNIIHFIRFGLVGVSGTIINLLVLYVLTEFFSLQYWLVIPFSYWLGITNNYIWNRKYTFNSTDKSFLHEYFKFLLSMLLGAIGYDISVLFLTEYFDIWYFYSAIISLVVSTSINFLLSKLWVFKPYRINVLDSIPSEIDKKDVSFLLIVSALNEEKNITEFTESLLQKLPKIIKFKLLLVNNGSTDKTGEEIEFLKSKFTNILTLQREKPLDYSNSIKQAIASQKIDTSYIGWAWSDNQITGEDVATVITLVYESQPKFAKIFRFERDYSFWRKIQSFCYYVLINILFPGKIQDVNGCPKIFVTELLPILNLQGNGWFLDTETVAKMIILVKESDIIHVPVSFNKRIHGKSKTNWFTALELFMQTMSFRLIQLRKWKKIVRNLPH